MSPAMIATFDRAYWKHVRLDAKREKKAAKKLGMPKISDWNVEAIHKAGIAAAINAMCAKYGLSLPSGGIVRNMDSQYRPRYQAAYPEFFV